MATILDLCEPSERLLEHYKKKALVWKEKVVELTSQVEDCKIICTQYADAEVELQKREVELARINFELNETKRKLFEEKQHVMKLVEDKDRLRLELLDGKRTFKMVLNVLGLKECEVSSFLQQSKSNSIKDDMKSLRIKKGVQKILELGLDPEMKFDKLKEDLSAANLKIKLLESQLEEQHCLFKEEIENLLKERRDLVDEQEEMRKRLQHRISCLNCRLETTRKKICEKLQIKIEAQDSSMRDQTKLMLENEKLLKCLIICKELLGEEFPHDLDKTRPKRLRDEITLLQGNLSEKLMTITTLQTQGSLLRAQIIKMQEELEENSDRFEKQNIKWMEKYELANKRLEKEHRRRVNDAVGFRNDIKLLRSSLQSLQRQIKMKEIKSKSDNDVDNKQDRNDINDKLIKSKIS